MPVIRVTAVVLAGENPNLVQQHALVDSAWKARHEILPDIQLDDAPPLWSSLDNADGTIDGVQELRAEGGNALCVKLRGLSKKPRG